LQVLHIGAREVSVEIANAILGYRIAGKLLHCDWFESIRAAASSALCIALRAALARL
jgi:hypothetical protein